MNEKRSDQEIKETNDEWTKWKIIDRQKIK